MGRLYIKHKHRKSFAGTIIFVLLLVAFFLRTYGPGRDLKYSDAGLALFVTITLIMMLRWAIKNRKIKKSVMPLFYWIFIISLFYLVTPLANQNFIDTGNVLKYFNNTAIQMVFMLFVTIYISSEKNGEEIVVKIAMFLIVISLVSAFVAVQLLLTGKSLAGPFEINTIYFVNQLSGWYTSPNTFVDVISLGLLASLFLYNRGGKYKRFLMMIFFVLMIVLIFSRSRGGIITALLTVAFLYYQSSLSHVSLNKKVVKYFKLITGVFAVIVLFFLLGSRLYQLEFESSLPFVEWFFRSYNISTGGGRMVIWNSVFGLLSENTFVELLFGKGIGWYLLYYGRSFHSTYLQFIFESGLVFTVAFVLFQSWSVFIIRQKLNEYKGSVYRKEIAFLASLVAFNYIRAFSQSGKFFSGESIWLISILSIGLILSINKSKENH